MFWYEVVPTHDFLRNSSYQPIKFLVIHLSAKCGIKFKWHGMEGLEGRQFAIIFGFSVITVSLPCDSLTVELVGNSYSHMIGHEVIEKTRVVNSASIWQWKDLDLNGWRTLALAHSSHVNLRIIFCQSFSLFILQTSLLWVNHVKQRGRKVFFAARRQPYELTCHNKIFHWQRPFSPSSRFPFLRHIARQFNLHNMHW